MNTKQFDEMCMKRIEMETLRRAVSFIRWIETPIEFRVKMPDWHIENERTNLVNCIEAYCTDAIRDCLCDKLKELEKDFEYYD